MRKPLNSILILGQHLSENPDGNLLPKQIEFARTIHGAGTDLLNLISDILDLSKIESGTVTVDAQEVLLGNLIEATARPFRHEADNRQLAFEAEIDPNLGPRLRPTRSGCSRCSRTCCRMPSSSPSRAAFGSRSRRRLAA